jgi:hypothetical protein
MRAASGAGGPSGCGGFGGAGGGGSGLNAVSKGGGFKISKSEHADTESNRKIHATAAALVLNRRMGPAK